MATPCWHCSRALVHDAALRAWCAAPHVRGADLAVVFERANECAQCCAVTCGVGRACAPHVGNCIACTSVYCAACFVGPRGRRGESAAAAVESLQRDACGVGTPELRCWPCEERRLGARRAHAVRSDGLWVH